jgi:hypothetical protein
MKDFHTWCVAATLSLTALMAQPAAAQQATIEERARGAERIVVATITGITSKYERNEFGDELIVSRATLAVEESVKGSSDALTTLEYEGGTVNGITLHVSSLPVLNRGERGVFFMKRGKTGEFKPHLRGQGILKLDAKNRVQGSSLTLEDVRRMARSQAR